MQIQLSAAATLPPSMLPVSLLQAGEHAMFVVDETMRLISADGVGRSELDHGDRLQLSLGRLCTGDHLANARIKDGIRRGQCANALELAGMAAGLTVDVVPLAVLDTSTGKVRQAVVIVRSRAKDVDTVEAVRLECALTASETEVARLIYKGLSTVEVARVMGIAKTTVRTHLSHIFEKTGTSRQSELVHFIATSSSV